MNRKHFKPGCTKILHNITTNTNKNYIAEAFNNFFTSVALNISSETPHTDIDFRDFLRDYIFTDAFFLPPQTPGKSKEFTSGLELTSGGHLEIPAKMFKMIIDLISLPYQIFLTSV